MTRSVAVVFDDVKSDVRHTMVGFLRACLVKLDYAVRVARGDKGATTADGTDVIHCRVEHAKPDGGARLVPDPNQEGFSILASPTPGGGSSVVVSSPSSRGLLFGVCRLVEEVDRSGVIPRSFDHASTPQLAIREWSTLMLQGGFNLPTGGAFDRPLSELEGAVNRVIDRAPFYGINRLQLPGRPGEGMDIDWFIPYRFLSRHARRDSPELHARRDLLRRLARRAHAHGLELIVWDHELVFPPEIVERYPECAGTDFPVCFSVPFWDGFVENKLEEFFSMVPEVDGVNLTFEETLRGYNLLQQVGCTCTACSTTSVADKLFRVFSLFGKVCTRLGKLFEARTYALERDRTADMITTVGRLSDAVAMTKYTLADFRGVDYPPNPLIGKFPNIPQIVEFTLTPECNGFGYVPAILGEFYRERIAHARQHGAAGCVGRVDYHLQNSHAAFFTDGPPVLTFDTENELNIHLFSRLMWAPEADVDALWHEWVTARYGDRAPELLIPPLRSTREITQGIYYVKGLHALSQLDQIADLAQIEWEIEDNFFRRFNPGDPEIERLTQDLLQPSEETLHEVLDEKDRAVALAASALGQILGAGSTLSGRPYRKLKRRFELLHDTAALWRWIAECYFRLQAHLHGSIRPEANLPSLDRALLAIIAHAVAMEDRFGRVYPVYNALRGITAYQFVLELVHARAGYAVHPADDLWYRLVDAAKKAPQGDGAAEPVAVPEGIAQLELGDRWLRMARQDGATAQYPLPMESAPLQLGGGASYALRIRKARRALQAEIVAVP